MERCKILAKSALDRKQLDVKYEIGCDGIEIQLLDELFGKKNAHDWLKADDVFDLQSFKNDIIDVIHAPLIRGRHDVNLEWITDKEDVTILDQICYIANYFGQIRGKMIYIVLHSESTVNILEDTANGWGRIANIIRLMLALYPNIVICIENVTLFRSIDNNGIQLSNNFYMDNVEMIKRLRQELHTNRIGLVLDTCHQGITEMYMSKICELAPEYSKINFSLEYYFQQYSPYLKIVHLADFKNSGYGRGNHGIGFTTETKDKLDYILDLKNKYSPYSYLTLELDEDDYLTCENYKTTLKLVREWFERQLK